MRHTRILLVLVVLMAIVIAGCDPDDDKESENGKEQEPTVEVTVEDNGGGETDEPICVVNRFDIEGQGEQMWLIGGATGDPAIAVDDQQGGTATVDQIIEMTDPRINPVADLETQDVAVIVLDDFYAFDGEEFSHGAVVSMQIQKQIRSRQPYDFDPTLNTINGFQVLTWRPENAPVMHIIEADTDFVIEQVITALQDALGVARDELGVTRAAVNMSFAVIPCEITEDFDLREYQRRIDGTSEGEPIPRRTILAAIAGDDGYMVTDTLQAVLGSPEERFGDIYGQLLALYGKVNESKDEGLDRLHQLIQETVGVEETYWNPGDRTVIYIGAAGNMGRNQECLIPARWPEVICTSASVIDDTPAEVAWEGSNTGQTMTLGGFLWIVTDPPQPLDLAYIGTSFAAPVVTSNLAFYLTVEELCQDPPLDISLTVFDDRPFIEALESAGCVKLN